MDSNRGWASGERSLTLMTMPLLALQAKLEELPLFTIHGLTPVAA